MKHIFKPRRHDPRPILTPKGIQIGFRCSHCKWSMYYREFQNGSVTVFDVMRGKCSR